MSVNDLDHMELSALQYQASFVMVYRRESRTQLCVVGCRFSGRAVRVSCRNLGGASGEAAERKVRMILAV